MVLELDVEDLSSHLALSLRELRGSLAAGFPPGVEGLRVGTCHSGGYFDSRAVLDLLIQVVHELRRFVSVRNSLFRVVSGQTSLLEDVLH